MKVPFAGIVDGWQEYLAVWRAMRSRWHGAGPQCEKLEQELAHYLGIKYALTVNSGSSANLLALASLNLKPGDLVLTSGCGFPATLNPILHLGLTPVLVDYDLETQNIDLNQVAKAFKKHGRHIKAVIFAHTMGNPVEMESLMKTANHYGAKVIEDCCEALGATYRGQLVGSFGHLATFSFYPSHQINGLGMGGAVVTNDEGLAIHMRSLRNWGKLARQPSFAGDHQTAYENKIDGIAYDDHYTYQTVGYNLMMPDVAAAYARVQLKRLPGFIRQRHWNWHDLEKGLRRLPLTKMPYLEGAFPSFFGFTLVCPDGKRDHFSKYLEDHGIRTRPFFAGNITRHQPYRFFYKEFPVADYLMKNALFIGVWPGLKQREINFVIKTIQAYFHG